jgi:C4-dicarboxylate-specific signal transduction histidine kinase
VDVKEIPRMFIFSLSALFAGLLSAAQRRAAESLRLARDDLKGTVQELERSNEALQAESAERIRAEGALRNAQADLARVSRLTTMGEFAASIAPRGESAANGGRDQCGYVLEVAGKRSAGPR